MKNITTFLFCWVIVLQSSILIAQTCTSSSTLTVQVAPSITLSGYKFNTGCLSNSGEIDLKVLPTATYTYKWSNNKTTQDIKTLVAGTYTVTVTNTAGCTKTASFVIAATTTAPDPQYIRGLTSCNPTSMTLKWEGPTTGSFEIRYRLSTATTYTNVGNVGNIESYAINGLQSNKTYLFQVRHVCVDGITKSAYKGTTKKTSNCFDGGGSAGQNLAQAPTTGSLTASPNPANNFIELAYTDEFSSNIDIVVADVAGRVMFRLNRQWHEGNSAWQLPISEWPTGIYQAIVKSPSGSTHTSFVVQH
jgi:hypothetical protein